MSKISEKLDAYEKLMRLDRPIGILLLLWPTLNALWISSYGHPNWAIVWVFVLGTVLMRSAGCVMNDLADRKFDGHVTRTQHRPLVTGLVSVKEALMLAAALSLAAFVLVWQLNAYTVKLSFVALFLAMTYPLMKRFISIPQAYLGIAFGFGIPMAFAAQHNQVPLVAWVLLLANIFWAVAYDTEYAMVDREDDVKVGIKSSALWFGKYDIQAIMLCYGMMLAIFLWLGLKIHFNWPYFVGIFLATGIALYHFRLIQRREPANCFKAFLHNNWLGAAIFIGLVANYYV